MYIYIYIIDTEREREIDPQMDTKIDPQKTIYWKPFFIYLGATVHPIFQTILPLVKFRELFFSFIDFKGLMGFRGPGLLRTFADCAGNCQSALTLCFSLL